MQLLGSGTIFREVIAAADLLKNDWGVDADLWSCPSFTELARDGYAVAALEPAESDGDAAQLATSRSASPTRRDRSSPPPTTCACSPSEIRPFVPRRYVVLGTDGFGRSDTREKLRHFFEVDRHWVTVAALKALADEGTLPASKVAEAMKKYGLDPAKPAPWTV